MSGPGRTFTPAERAAWEGANTTPLPVLRLNVLRHQRRGREIEADRVRRFAERRAPPLPPPPASPDLAGDEPMQASIGLKLDRSLIGRLCRLGYLLPTDRDPAVIRDAAAAALADRLAPSPAALVADERH